MVKAFVRLGKEIFPHTFYIVPSDCSIGDCILGTDFLSKFNSWHFDFVRGEMTVAGMVLPLQGNLKPWESPVYADKNIVVPAQSQVVFYCPNSKVHSSELLFEPNQA